MADQEHDTPEHEIDPQADADATQENVPHDPLAELQAKHDELESRHLRLAADYQNFVRRSQLNEVGAVEQTTMSMGRQLLTVMDHFDQALAVDPEKTRAAALLTGVQMVRDELAKTLSGFGIERFAPEPGDAFDPNRHEAMMRQAAEGLQSNAIVMTLSPGYLLGEKTLRPAKVAVAE